MITIQINLLIYCFSRYFYIEHMHINIIKNRLPFNCLLKTKRVYIKIKKKIFIWHLFETIYYLNNISDILENDFLPDKT